MSNNPDANVSKSEGGVKFDQDKEVRWDLLLWDALEEIAKVLNVDVRDLLMSSQSDLK